MWRHLRSSRALLCAIVLAVFAVQTSGVHLHLCFDGKEPPTTVHFADGLVHEDHHGEDDHADADVDPFAGVFNKKPDADGYLASLVHATALILLSPPAGGIPLPLYESPHVPDDSPFLLRPPLRGPPA